MSIRFIGYQNYIPIEPGNYAKGKTKVIRLSSQPNDQQLKANKIQHYREELDKQVEQIRRRKQEAKRREFQEDERRQKQFYQSLQYAKRAKNNNHSPTHNSSNVRNFHLLNKQYSGHASRFRQKMNNPEQSYSYHCRLDGEDLFGYESRIAKNRYKLDVPIFYSRSDLINQQDDISNEKRRRNMIDELDKNLQGAYNAIQRSRGNSHLIDQQLQRLRRRLRTQQSHFASGQQDGDYNPLYNLPYKNYLYNSPNKYFHKRQRSWQ